MLTSSGEGAVAEQEQGLGVAGPIMVKHRNTEHFVGWQKKTKLCPSNVAIATHDQHIARNIQEVSQHTAAPRTPHLPA